MSTLEAIKDLARKNFQLLLENDDLRRRLVFEIKQNYFDNLDFNIPIGQDLLCTLNSNESVYSFSEIFIQNEYAKAFAQIPLPLKWLDIGAYHGYFSLYLCLQHRLNQTDKKIQGLLIDADPRSIPAVEKLIKTNKLESQLDFLSGAITASTEAVDFIQRPVMLSSIDSVSPGQSISISPLKQETILARLLPPYDLVKVDIEGGEYEFLNAYDQVLANTNYLLLEWHSWHKGGGGKEGIIALAKQKNFKQISEIMPEQYSNIDKQETCCGVILFERV